MSSVFMKYDIFTSQFSLFFSLSLSLSISPSAFVRPLAISTHPIATASRITFNQTMDTIYLQRKRKTEKVLYLAFCIKRTNRMCHEYLANWSRKALQILMFMMQRNPNICVEAKLCRRKCTIFLIAMTGILISQLNAYTFTTTDTGESYSAHCHLLHP